MMLPTNTNVAPNPLQRLASLFQQAGITPTNSSGLLNMVDGQQPVGSPQVPTSPQQPQTDGSALSKMAGMVPGLGDSLGMGTQQSWDGQSPQTSNLEGILHMLKGTTINGADQVTAQPSFINSIYKMLP
jgi:hypothetical protein